MKKNSAFLDVLSSYFTEYLPVTKGLSSNSIRSYKYSFQLLFSFLKEEKGILPEKVTFHTLEKDVPEQFLSWLEKCRSCSISTRNQRLSCISSFSKYAARKEPVEAAGFHGTLSSIPKKKESEKMPVYFTKEEISIMLHLPSGIGTVGYRDLVLLSVLYASGARAQELCDLKVSDIRFGEKASIKLIGKGKRGRIITIPDDCAVLLKTYLEYEKKAVESHVFSSQTHEHMTISCVEEIVKKYVREAKRKHPALFKEKRYTPHTFRHSIAVHMLEAGVPLPVIKNFLGHVSLETTLIYATVSDELKDKYLAEHSLANILPVKAALDYEDIGLEFLKKI